jgi:hypothetical protein
MRNNNPELYPLLTEKGAYVGNIYVMNDDQYLTVRYELAKGWQLGETNLQITNDLQSVPMASDWTPIPSLFEHTTSHRSEMQIFEYMIPLNGEDQRLGDKLIIAANAIIVDIRYPFGTGNEISVWGGGNVVTSPVPWYFMEYTLRHDSNVPVPANEAEIASESIAGAYIK